jgi:flagellar secretion chaperone FliS
MTSHDPRARFLRERVLTASPAQRVVMIYDRLLLDLTRAGAATTSLEAGPHLSHAMEIVAELQASLDLTAGGPAQNLASLYGFVMQELIAARGGELARVSTVAEHISTLRSAWAQAAETVLDEPRVAATAGSWTG